MTTTTGVTVQPGATVSESQIRQENAEIAAIEGGYIPDQVSTESNQNPAQQSTEQQNPSLGDRIRSGQQEAADDRENFMAEIARRRREMLNEENSEPSDWDNDEIVDNPDEVQQNQVQEQETQAAQVAPQPQEVAQVQDDQPVFFTDGAGQNMVRLKVNGQVTEVPAQRLFAAAQKMEAGDQRLREAAQERQRLDAERQAFEQQKLASQQIQQPSQVAVDPELREKIRDGLVKFQEGDESAVDGLVDTLVQGRQPTTPQIDTHQLAQQVLREQNLTAWGNNLNADASAFDADPAYKDITGNPVLAQRAQALASQYVNQNQSWYTGERPRDIMNRMAEQVRSEAKVMAEAYGYVAPQPQVTTTQPDARSVAVEQRKAQAGNTAVGGGAQRQASQAPKPVAQDGGRSPSSMDSKVAAFADMVTARTTSAIKR